MKHKGNKLTPTEGMHLKRKSDGSIFEGDIFIPDSLTTDDFEEVTHEEYLQSIQQNKTEADSDITERISKLEKESKRNLTELTSLQRGFSSIKEFLAGLGNLTKL
ncbi:MAG: hypothetical protein UHY68_03220 [Acutalibacteraceae bacterium]|nr:hypothetical protein [Acutalibacteraceae bacterium]